MAQLILPIPMVAQRDRPFCLYACTSMVLRYFGIVKSVDEIASEIFTPNLPYTGEQDLPTNVEAMQEYFATIRDYLRDHGLNAKIYSDEVWTDTNVSARQEVRFSCWRRA